MIVVDTSVIVAMFAGEAETSRYLTFLAETLESCISAASVLEASIVIRLRLDRPAEAEAWLDDFLDAMHIAVEPVTLDDLRLARAAHMRFGKGTGHPAQLNFGDCFSYALARRLTAPLLCKGDDFPLTDITVAR